MKAVKAGIKWRIFNVICTRVNNQGGWITKFIARDDLRCVRNCRGKHLYIRKVFVGVNTFPTWVHQKYNVGAVAGLIIRDVIIIIIIIIIIKIIITIKLNYNYHKNYPRIHWGNVFKSFITLTILYVEDHKITFAVKYLLMSHLRWWRHQSRDHCWIRVFCCCDKISSLG